MSKIFQLPVKVINDADAAALAEARYGSLQDLDCGAALVLGTGVGLGLVSQGALLTPLSVTQYLRAPIPKAWVKPFSLSSWGYLSMLYLVLLLIKVLR